MNNPLGLVVTGSASFLQCPTLPLIQCIVLKERDVKYLPQNISTSSIGSGGTRVDKDYIRKYEIVKGLSMFSNNVVIFSIRVLNDFWGWNTVFWRAVNKKTDVDGEKEKAIIAEVTAKLDEIEQDYAGQIERDKKNLGIGDE